MGSGSRESSSSAIGLDCSAVRSPFTESDLSPPTPSYPHTAIEAHYSTTAQWMGDMGSAVGDKGKPLLVEKGVEMMGAPMGAGRAFICVMRASIIHLLLPHRVCLPSYSTA